MDHSKIIDFIRELRQANPVMEEIFMEGSCLNLHYMIKALYPEAKSYYNQVEGHVITKLGERYYDVRGVVTDIDGYLPLDSLYSKQYRDDEESKKGHMYRTSNKAKYERKVSLAPIAEVIQMGISPAERSLMKSMAIMAAHDFGIPGAPVFMKDGKRVDTWQEDMFPPEVSFVPSGAEGKDFGIFESSIEETGLCGQARRRA